MTIDKKKALYIGTITCLIYSVSYCIRNLLTVLTPYMISGNIYNENQLALFASVYMLLYASGQLLNGIIGDHIKSKYMVSSGLFVSGISLLFFGVFNSYILGIICFALFGFGLSMLRGPLVKVISENTIPKYARICCVFLSYSTSLGPFFAGILAIVFKWNTVFTISGTFTVVLSVLSFLSIGLFEKKKYIVPIEQQKDFNKKEKTNFWGIFKLKNFVMYMLIGMIIEIGSTSIGFWLPTYFSQYLNLTEGQSSMIFSATVFIGSFSPFLGLSLFKLAKERDMLVIRYSFGTSIVLFTFLLFIKNALWNIVFLTVARLCIAVSSCMLWSIYIPSLGKSGKVSGANGVLDCSGYVGASIVNYITAPIISGFGWKGVIIFWAFIVAVGFGLGCFSKNTES